MRRSGILLVTVITLTVILAVSYPGGHHAGNVQVVQDTLIKYQDGIFEGQSRDRYIDEPYWGRVCITIQNGLFTGIIFVVRDSNLHETFNENYEKHFQDNAVYIQQCRNDWNGVKTYPVKLLEVQNIGKLDATTGATWSYNIFKASFNEALKNAVKTPE